MCANSTASSFRVDICGKSFIFTDDLGIKKGHSILFSFSIVNDMLAKWQFRKLQKTC